MTFINGEIIIKKGRSVFAKIRYRPDFFKGLNINYNKKYPYSIQIKGLGQAECETLEKCKELLNKYSTEFENLHHIIG